MPPNDDEYVILEIKITKRSYGSERKEKLKNIKLANGSHELSPEFKDMLWDDMNIDIDALLKEYGDTQDISKLIIDAQKHPNPV